MKKFTDLLRIRSAAKAATAAAALAASNLARAQQSIQLSNQSGAGFDILTDWMQNFVDFMSGPFGTAVVVVSIIVAFAVWAFAPKEGIAGPVLRIVVAGIVILNIATWMGTLSGAEA